MDEQNNNPQQALINSIKDRKNILVTVSNNPSVDQLAACLGLTLWLNKLGKHATAVFSGEVPSTLEFLEPAATLEKNTDSLRDFIISLDKSKADKLRYKVEDSIVKVFVTPYRTSLSAADLEFSQGDFNVDMVVALGVHNQAELDAAITAHGRILHDAVVSTVTIGDLATDLGSINWHDMQASSLCELVVELANGVDQAKIDNQIATALLTGVVAETERFSNDKTTPQTMSVSAQLMSAGANQQLVASKLEEPPVVPDPVADQPEEPAEPEAAAEATSPESEQSETPAVNEDGLIAVDHEEPPVEPDANPASEINEPSSEVEPTATSFMTDAPELGGTLTANSTPEDAIIEPATDPLSQTAAEPAGEPLLSHEDPDTAEQPVEPVSDADQFQPAPPNWMPPQPWMAPPAVTETVAADEPTLPEPLLSSPAELDVAPESAASEQTIDEPTPIQTDTPDLDQARDEVLKAIDSTPPANPEPVQALNAQPIELEQSQELPIVESSTTFDPNSFGVMNDPELPLQAPPMPPFPPQSSAIPTADPNQPVDPELTSPVDQPLTLPLPPSPLMPTPASPLPPTSTDEAPKAPPVPPPFNPPS